MTVGMGDVCDFMGSTVRKWKIYILLKMLDGGLLHHCFFTLQNEPCPTWYVIFCYLGPV